MTVEELKVRITKKEEQITKLERAYNKYATNKIEKEIIDRFLQSGNRDEYRDWCQSLGQRYYYSDAWSKANELYDARKTLEKYQSQLEVIQDKENTLNDIPEVLKEFGQHLLERWNIYDSWKKELIKEEYRNTSVEYHERCYNLRKKWGAGWHDFMYLTTDQIHKMNEQAVDSLILNLVNRTIEIAGKIVDCKGLILEQDNAGYAIINGLVIGEKGKARVESIGAGGYNIQRYHIRVLVKEVK